MSPSRLLQPLQVGTMALHHRIGMAPLTRFRSTDGHVPTPLNVVYYAQRASVPGTLIISEGTIISPCAGGWANAPGIWNADQISAWRAVTDAVHAKGCYMACQIFAMGRAAVKEVAEKEGIQIVAPSALRASDDPNYGDPMAMTKEQIRMTIKGFVDAARNARDAGFDAVEIHVGNGYLLDQFLQDVSNQRDDEYGGSIENRSRLIVEVMRAVVDAIGADRTGIRFSPWSTFQGMRMADPVPQFTDVIRRADALGLAYMSLIESRISGSDQVSEQNVHSLDFAYKLWKRPLLVAGGYNADTAHKLVNEQYPDRDIVVLFGRHYVSTPDLPFRVKQRLPPNRYNRSTFYVQKSPLGYTDYPFSDAYLQSVEA